MRAKRVVRHQLVGNLLRQRRVKAACYINLTEFLPLGFRLAGQFGFLAGKIGQLGVGLSPYARQALLLTAMEGFTTKEAASILGGTVAQVATEIAAARQTIATSLHARVMIIEDEAIIALHIRTIVQDLGHEMVGIAQTRTEACALAARTKPDLVLADIRLADGSSGIDAVRDIMVTLDVPVIFITAFPERLLTGERPEPTFLITKPFQPETVTATIGQALLVHRERAAIEIA
jgi:CheY-like chemotaxis protein